LGEKPDCGDPILVADGDAPTRTLIAGLLAHVGYRTLEATSGHQALALTASEQPRLFLIDVELPGISGYETCRELRDRYGNTLPIVLLSATRVEPLDRIAGLLIGADDYIVKPFDPGELLARVRTLLRRHTTNNGNNHNDNANGRTGLHTLTGREREILDLLAHGRSQDDIAGELYITPKTVATHIQRVLTKLGVHSRAQAVAFALRHTPTDTEPDPNTETSPLPAELEPA